jgi:hypothetical protein
VPTLIENSSSNLAAGKYRNRIRRHHLRGLAPDCGGGTVMADRKDGPLREGTPDEHGGWGDEIEQMV